MSDSTPYHEAGHELLVHALGWPVGAVTATAGERLAGCALYTVPAPSDDPPGGGLPLALWPGSWQRWATGQALIHAAGDLAAHLFAPQHGRAAEDVITMAAAMLEEETPPAPAAGAARTRLHAVVNSAETASDAEQLASLAGLVHGADMLTAASWLGWCGEECRAVLLANAAGVRRLAGLLAVAESLSAEAVAACLERRR